MNPEVRSDRSNDMDDSLPDRRLGTVPGFDGMRGVMILIVFISHTEVILPIPSLLVVPGGTVSLSCFFVLSGFLITTLMLREQARTARVDKVAFYRRRAVRLLPPLAAVLVAQATFAYASGSIPFHEEWTSLVSILFYFANWKMALHSNFFGAIGFAPGLQHLWSLSVEEQFYLVWPWITILVLGIRRRLRTVVVVLLSLIAAIGIHRALSYHGPATWYPLFIRTDTRADAILWGALLAHIWIRRREPKRGINVVAWVAAGFLLACLPLVNMYGPFLYLGGFDAIELSCAVLVLAIVGGTWGGRHLFEFRPLMVLGVVSYALYLWHLPIFFAVRYYGGGWGDIPRVVVATSLSLLLTTLSWFLLERPAQRWRRRIEAKAPSTLGRPTEYGTPPVRSQSTPT